MFKYSELKCPEVLAPAMYHSSLTTLIRPLVERMVEECKDGIGRKEYHAFVSWDLDYYTRLILASNPKIKPCLENRRAAPYNNRPTVFLLSIKRDPHDAPVPSHPGMST
jgi:hypothetical protein